MKVYVEVLFSGITHTSRMCLTPVTFITVLLMSRDLAPMNSTQS